MTHQAKNRILSFVGIVAIVSTLGAGSLDWKPLENGLNFQMDAMDGTAFTTDADGSISEWRASAGRLGFAFTNASPAVSRPYRSSSPFDARGAVVFGYDNDTDKNERPTHLTANGETTNKTVFLVFHRYAGVNYGFESGGYSKISTAKNDGIFGVVGNSGSRGFYGDTYNRICNVMTGGGYAWWNGDETANPSTSIGTGFRVCPTEGNNERVVEPTLFAGEMSDETQAGTSSFIGMTAIGHYSYPKNPESQYFHGAVAELLSYDRVLTADERNYTFEYLRHKWLGTGAAVVEGDTAVVTVATGERVVVGSLGTSGWLVKRGGGELAFCRAGSDPSSVRLQVLSGSIDLAGTTQVVAAVTGNGVVTNAAKTRAALVIDSDSASVCEPLISGDVSLIKRGAGELALFSMQGYAGGTELSGGVLSVVSNIAPAAIGGRVFHLDASQSGTMATNVLGEVVSWESAVGGLLATNDSTDARLADCFPVYDRTAFGNRGGVRFGCKPDNTVTGTFLKVSQDITNRTVFLVVQPNAAQIANNIGWYGEFGVSQGGVTQAKGAHRYLCNNSLFTDGRVAINGGVQYDGTVATGTGNVYWDALADGVPHLVSIVAPDETHVFAPSVGAFYLTTQKYYLWQGAIGEVLVYDRALTENEVQTVERSLMAKWGITPAWVTSPKAKTAYVETSPVRSNPLASEQSLAVTGSATLDFSGMSQEIATVAFGRLVAGTLPCLNVIGSLSLANTALALPEGAIAPQALMTAQEGAFDGAFKAVSPASAAGRVKCKPHEVKFGTHGLMMILW